MAPDPEILKRKRSRPSEWWAAAPSSVPPHLDRLPQKKRVLSERKTQNVSTAASRGKRKENNTGNENRNGNENQNMDIVKSGWKQILGTTQDELQSTSTTDPSVEQFKRRQKRPSTGRVGMAIDTDLHTPETRKALRKGSSPDAPDELTAAVEPATASQSSAKTRTLGISGKDRKANHNGEATKPNRRGASSITGAEAKAVHGNTIMNQHGHKKDARPATDTIKSSIPSPQEEPLHKRRARRLNALIEGRTIEDQGKEFSHKSTDGRHQGTVVAQETATSSFAKDRPKSRKREEIVRTTNPKAVAFGSAGPSKSKKPIESNVGTSKSSTVEVQGQKLRQESSGRIGSRKRKEPKESLDELQEAKRRRAEDSSQSDMDEISHQGKIPDYQHLTAVTRRVSRQTIESKWEPLPPGCVELISQFLQDLQRPVIVRLNDERRRAQASTALQMISRRLISKISKGLPFPGTRSLQEDDFNFEKVLYYNKVLEAQLTPALHANELLEAELDKETALLESEQASLYHLETNAKTEAAIRKQAGHKLHSLLWPEDSIAKEDPLKYRIGLEDNRSSFALSLDMQEDENLQAIFTGINDHVDSIQGNINQVQGITKAVLQSKAAVKAILFDRLEESQYEEVILG